MQSMYYIGHNIHKNIDSYCVKDASGTRFTQKVPFPLHAPIWTDG